MLNAKDIKVMLLIDAMKVVNIFEPDQKKIKIIFF